MFDIRFGSKDEVVLSGRFDASEVEKAKAFFENVKASCTVDFKALDYISSAGLGVLLMTQKRLNEKNHSLMLVNMSRHVQDVFKWARFDLVFKIH